MATAAQIIFLDQPLEHGPDQVGLNFMMRISLEFAKQELAKFPNKSWDFLHFADILTSIT